MRLVTTACLSVSWHCLHVCSCLVQPAVAGHMPHCYACVCCCSCRGTCANVWQSASRRPVSFTGSEVQHAELDMHMPGHRLVKGEMQQCSVEQQRRTGSVPATRIQDLYSLLSAVTSYQTNSQYEFDWQQQLMTNSVWRATHAQTLVAVAQM